jgi:hypothetical protein
MITCSRKMPPKWNGHTWAILFFVISYCPMLWGQTTEVSLGNDFIVGEGETFTLHANIALPVTLPPGSSGLVSSEATYSLAWFERTIDETNYPNDPFATTTLEASAGTTSISEVDIEPIEESTYYKVVLTDAAGVSCEAEVLGVLIRLSKILFHDSHTIYHDPDTPPFNTGPDESPMPFVNPTSLLPDGFHWLKATATGLITAKPVAYTRNTPFKVSAFVIMNGLAESNIELSSIKLKGTATAVGFSADIAMNVANLTALGNGYLFGITTASAAFPDVVGVYDLAMEWQYSENSGTDWAVLGNTANKVYATLNVPTMTNPDQYLFHTTINMACTEAAGLNSESATVDAIYAKIVTRNVQDLSGEPLQYWASGFGLDSHNTQQLLYHNDGQCGAWAHFWIDLLHTHGVLNVKLANVRRIFVAGDPYAPSPLPDNTNSLVANAVNSFNNLPLNDIPPDYDLEEYSLLMVPNWDITQNQFYRQISIFPTENFEPLLSTNANAAEMGIEAQSIGNPVSFFNDHALVRLQFSEIIDGVEVISYKYYDPSYGTGPFVAQTDEAAFGTWESNSIVGFCAYIQYGIAPDITRLLWIEKVNVSDTNTDLNKNITDY